MAERNRSTPIDHSLVAEYLSYCPETGHIVWIKKPAQNIPVGRVAGGIRVADRGYVVIGFRRRTYYAHRLAWALHTGTDLPAGAVIDHRNGDTSDNRWSNLRIGTQSQNLANSDHQVGRSGVRGVIYDKAKRKWRAQISHQGKCKWLGNFDSVEEAAATRRAAEGRLYGEFSFTESRK